MARLDTERQEKLEPQRMQYAKEQITALGYAIHFESDNELRFDFEGEQICFFPYSGWHTGKTITDGRGINKLLNQIK